MARSKQENAPMRLPRTPEEYEMQNIALAMRLSSERLRDGSASAQEILYWLKQGSPEAVLQREILQGQRELLSARVEEIKATRRDAEMYQEAIAAMNSYQPSQSDYIEGDFEEG